MADKEKFMRMLGISLFILFVLVFMANSWIKKEYTKSTTISNPSDVLVPVEEAKKPATAPLLTVNDGGTVVKDNAPAGSGVKKAAVKKIYEIPLADPILVQ